MSIRWDKISLKDLAGYISEKLRSKQIDCVLVGGACVSIYTKNRYQSYDLDFVTYTEFKVVKDLLLHLGFKYVSSYFKKEGCPWMIEFVSPPVAIGQENIDEFHKLKTSLGTIKLLRPTDCVKDRLASYYHWNDKEGLEQALLICADQKIDLRAIKRWSIDEKQEEKLSIILKRLKA